MNKLLNMILLLVFISIISCDEIANINSKDVRLTKKITYETAKELKNEKELRLIGRGGSFYDGEVREMGMSFTIEGEYDIDRARELVVYCAEKYLHNINSNESIQPYLHYYPFTSKNIEIEIFFTNKVLAAICVHSGLVTYYEEKKHLNIIHEETYEEALEILQKENIKNYTEK